MKLELFFSKLLAATIAGRETARMISGSPQIREVAELATGFYTAEGDCVLQSTGIIIHIPIMGEVIKWMITQGYEHEEGLFDGDIFTSNDNAIAGMHPPDVYDLIPIFYRDILIGWAATVIMEAELGAIAPGGMPSAASERFLDGIRFSAEKTGEKDVHYRSFERRIRSGMRMPDLFLLDRKAALAADIKVREEIKRIIDEFGLDYFIRAQRELIELERRTQLERVKRRTVPGKFHAPVTFENYMTKTFVAPHHSVDQITLVPMDFIIQPDGKYFLDLDGAGPWGWHPSNTTPSSMRGAMCLLLSQTLAYTGSANEGTMMCVDMNLPYDSYVNPSSKNIATGNLFSFPINGGGAWLRLQSMAFFSRGFVEECITGSPTSAGIGICGKDHYGNDFGLLITDPAGTCGSGAFAIRDGVTGYTPWQPVSDMGNVETWELLLPLSWTGRRLLPNSCGWGKYRGGFPIIATWMVHKSEVLAVDIIPIVLLTKIYPNSGMFGGYTGAGPFFQMIEGANTEELLKNKLPLLHSYGNVLAPDIKKNIKGRHILETARGVSIPAVFRHGDWIQVNYGTQSGGFGDPIKRIPELIKKDLDNGLINSEACEKVFAVAASYDEQREEWVIDQIKTHKLREAKKEERLRKGISAKEWWKKRRKDILQGKMPELMKDMYNRSLNKGKHWPKEFRSFWMLPDDFTF
jgi:N-methylhydantoinase B/oxoprolinase/acetone carboxylase alpha subunit